MSFIDLSEIKPIHEAYAASIGRALVVCQHVEDCARHVQVAWAVTDRMIEGEEDRAKLQEIAGRFRKYTLSRRVQYLEGTPDFGEDRIRVIDIGRLARNWLAHETGDVVEMGAGPEWFIERLKEFRDRTLELCEAAELLARASYEICEGKPASRDSRGYATRLYGWVVTPVADAAVTEARKLIED